MWGCICMRKKINKFKKCPQCGRLYEREDIFYCYNDNHPLVNYETDSPIEEQLRTFNRRTYKSISDYSKTTDIKKQHTPICPTCGSKNIKKVSTLKRLAHLQVFGLFSKTAFAQFVCNNCGYKW